MRYALRNQEKIKSHFEPNGDEMLNRIKDSLKRFFENAKNKEDVEKNIGISGIAGKYPVLSINDVENENRMIDFYVLGFQYDVYKLAFIGFSKC